MKNWWLWKTGQHQLVLLVDDLNRVYTRVVLKDRGLLVKARALTYRLLPDGTCNYQGVRWFPYTGVGCAKRLEKRLRQERMATASDMDTLLLARQVRDNQAKSPVKRGYCLGHCELSLTLDE